MEKQLISFGNYLLERYGVMVHSTDGKNTPIFQREVGDADLCNWKEKEGYNSLQLPSGHQIGEFAWLCLWSSPIASQIHGVHFYEGKVKYDLKVVGEDGLHTRIYNVDSAFVSKYK